MVNSLDDIIVDNFIIFLYPSLFLAYNKNLLSFKTNSIPIIGFILLFLHSR